MVWEIIFMLVILKIPIVYLCAVIWWAIKAEPSPPDLAEQALVVDTPLPGGSQGPRRRARRRLVRPHRSGRGGKVVRNPQRSGART